MRKPVIIIASIGILLIIVSAGFFVWHIGSRLFPGIFPIHISAELLHSPPISHEPGIEYRIVHRIDPHTLLENRPFGASNAATSYIAVIQSMESRTGEEGREPGALQPSGLSEDEFHTFMHGVGQAECDFSRESLVLDGKPVRLAPAVDISDSLPHIPFLRKMALAVVARGEQYESFGETEMAVRCYEGVVKFGLDIERGRESLIQLLAGMSIQKSGAERLQEFYQSAGEAEKAEQWSNFLRDLDDMIERFKHKMKTLTVAPASLPEFIANRLWILENDDDHLFRREALAGLGATRALAPDIIGPALEKTAASDPDPYVREAAENALKAGEISNEPN